MTMMGKKAFGKDLEAVLTVAQTNVSDFFGKKADEKTLGNFYKLDILAIKSGSCQPRKDFNEELLKELAASIKEQGIIQPIIVRQKNEYYEIIAGERRWRAAKLAGLTKVPAIICDISNEVAIAFGLIENIQRHDLNAIEEAYAFQRLINDFSMTHEKVAEIVGKSRVYITNISRLLSLPGAIQEMVTKGLLEMGHARAILTLPEKQQLYIANEIINKKLSVRDVEKLVQRIKSGDDFSSIKKIQKEGRVVDLERRLAEKLSGKVNITVGKEGKGKISVYFDSISKIEWLLECLN